MELAISTPVVRVEIGPVETSVMDGCCLLVSLKGIEVFGRLLTTGGSTEAPVDGTTIEVSTLGVGVSAVTEEISGVETVEVDTRPVG